MHKWTFRKPSNIDEWLEKFCFYTWYGQIIFSVATLALLWVSIIVFYAMFEPLPK